MKQVRNINLHHDAKQGAYVQVIDAVSFLAEKHNRSVVSEAARLMSEHPEVQRAMKRVRRNGKARRNGR